MLGGTPSLFYEWLEWSSSPYINHFLQPDSIIPSLASSQSWNRYSYVENNPLRFYDPTGHSPNAAELSSGGGDDLFLIAMAVIIGIGLTFQYDRGRRHPASDEMDCLGTLSECFNKHELKNFAPNETINEEEFQDMLGAINDNLHSKWRTKIDPARADYDTPFFNGDDGSGDVDDDTVCINGKCSPQSAVNYVAQGMYSAHTGQSLDDAKTAAQRWNRWAHFFGSGKATEDELYWLEYGYNQYKAINKNTNVNSLSKSRRRDREDW